MDRQILDLYDSYRTEKIDRRIFLQKLSVLAGGASAALALLPLLESGRAQAAMVPPGDARLAASSVSFDGASGKVDGYLARPKGDEKLPGIVVVHENRGLNAHIEDVARRLALEGFLTLAPDALSPAGGTPPVQEEAIEKIRQLDMEKTTGDFVAATKYLDAHPECTGKVGVVGFCWGGAMANQLAVRSDAVDAAVPYYGRQPDAAEVAKIKASLLLHYAGLDDRINAGIAAYETALKAAGVDYKIYMYEGAQHAFNNDTNEARYNKEAAQLAWGRTVDFFKEKLKNG